MEKRCMDTLSTVASVQNNLWLLQPFKDADMNQNFSICCWFSTEQHQILLDLEFDLRKKKQSPKFMAAIFLTQGLRRKNMAKNRIKN